MLDINCDSKTLTIIQDQTLELIYKYADLIDNHQLDEVYEKLSADNAFCGMAISYFSITYILQQGNVFYSLIHNIPDYFLTCANIQEFIVPDTFQSIGKEAFNNCKDLVAITIPKSIKEIKENAFANCPNLKLIYYKGTQNDFNNINIKIGNNDFKKAEIQFVK